MSINQSEQAIYKQLSENMRAGLKGIYQQISSASAEHGSSVTAATDALFHEASDQLDEVLKGTEKAVMTIMGTVEKHLELQAEVTALLNAVRAGNVDNEIARLTEINNMLGDDLTNTLTALSFQDITGQRIKKVVTALNSIEKSVVDLYISSGLMIDSAEKDPKRDVKTLQNEAQKAVEDFRQQRKVTSELKGPSNDGASQSAIDDMLAQLGM